MSQTELQKETSIQNEQQFKTRQEIIKDILNVLLQNKNISFYAGKDILREAIDQLGTTPFSR